MLKNVLLAASALAISAGAAYAAPAIGLVNGNQLFDFDTTAPTISGALRNITGLQGNDSTLTGLDFRPTNAALYGLANSGNLYTINPLTGVATFTAAFTTSPTGASSDIAFNPTVDRLRTVGPNGQNLRTNVDGGATTVDGNINPGGSNVVAIAYTNQRAGTVATTILYDITNAGNLTIQNPPNDGTLVPVGSLGVSGITGFDIDGVNGNAAFASTGTSLYSINLGTGAATLVGGFGVSGVTDIAIVGVPEPMSIAMLGFGLVGLAAIRRRI